MPGQSDVVLGALKLLGVVEDEFFESVTDLLQRIETLYGVEIPPGISNVIVGVSPPSEDQRDVLWIQKDNAGNFVSINVYAIGAWRAIYPAPGQIFLVGGPGFTSQDPPKGFAFVGNSPNFTQSQKTFLSQFWHWSNDVPDTFYDIFHVVYSGF